MAAVPYSPFPTVDRNNLERLFVDGSRHSLGAKGGFYVRSMSSSSNVGAKPLLASTSHSSLSSSSKDVLSFPKSRKANQNLHSPPFPPPFKSSLTHNLPSVERIDPSLVPRNSQLEPSIPGRSTSVRRPPGNRANGGFPPRSSSIPSVVAQALRPTGTPIKVNVDNDAPSRLIRPPTSPVPRQSSPRGTVRPSLMKRLTRRLRAPRSMEDNDPASLPIQPAPSTRRRSARISCRRTSRRASARNSGIRTSSTRLSRAPSALGSPHSPAGLPEAISTGALEDNSSSYSTDSEQEQPITMRPPRLERVRAAALVTSRVATLTTTLPVQDPISELIEEITGQLEGRISRDTMSSAFEFSLKDYCNAFPAPPTPGIGPTAPWGAKEEHMEQINQDISPQAEPAVCASSTVPLERGPILRNPSSHPSLGASNSQIKLELTLRTSASWDNLSSWPMLSPEENKPSPPPVPAGPNLCESRVVTTSANERQSVSTQFSLTSSGPTSPSFPATPPIARPRSLDPLSQARRKTRIVCGYVIDNAENDELAGERPSEYIVGLASIASVQDVPHEPTGRRGSDKASFSSPTHEGPKTHVPSPPRASYCNTLPNSPNDGGESANIGVALTTESRELAGPPLISFSEHRDTGLTLYARRKGRKLDFSASGSQLRVNPPPLHSSSQKTPSSVVSSQSLATSGSNGTFEGAIVTPNIQNEFQTGSVIQTPPSKSTATKRKSFFRYPFSSKRSTGSLKLAHTTAGIQGTPPSASPRARDYPMSATPTKLGFTPHELSVGGQQPSAATAKPSAHPIRYANPTSKFISFSRPSSSRGKVPVRPDFLG